MAMVAKKEGSLKREDMKAEGRGSEEVTGAS